MEVGTVADKMLYLDIRCLKHLKPVYVEVTQVTIDGEIHHQVESDVCGGETVDDEMNLVEKCDPTQWVGLFQIR
jgi:hypothetical protein